MYIIRLALPTHQPFALLRSMENMGRWSLNELHGALTPSPTAQCPPSRALGSGMDDIPSPRQRRLLPVHDNLDRKHPPAQLPPCTLLCRRV